MIKIILAGRMIRNIPGNIGLEVVSLHLVLMILKFNVKVIILLYEKLILYVQVVTILAFIYYVIEVKP